MTSHPSDERWMRLALSLGQRGLGNVWPNPAVGCVIVRDGRVVGRGWTQPGGRPHAEPQALSQAAELAQGATAYVTLEPCAHVGKTDPCAIALVAAGIKRVVCATTDPDPRVSGKGFEILRQAGVEVCEGVLKTEADQAHAGFFLRLQHNRPFVTLKLASSLDGRIATQTGDSRWITGPQARRSVHLMRAQHDAILVGRSTVEKDDPDLTVRDMDLQHRSPVRIVLDSRLQMPSSCKLVETADETPLWICCHTPKSQTKLTDTSAEIITCKQSDTGNIDILDALYQLAERGITRLMVEGGGKVAASFLANDCVDQLAVYSAGVAIGSEGLPNLGQMGISALSDAPRFERCNTKILGQDVLTIWNKKR